MTINETPDAALPPDVAALLSVEDGPSPSAEVRARVLERVQATVSGQGDAGSAANGAQGLGGAAGALAVLLALGAVFSPGNGPPVEEVIPGAALVDGDDAPSSRAARVAATPMKASPAPSAEPLVLTSVVDDEPPAPPASKPSAVVPAPVEPSDAAPAKAQTKPRPARDLAAERTLLDRARSALGTGDPAGALRTVREHRRLYPRGALVEERESLWVRALLDNANIEGGKKRAERFLKRYPRSIHRGAVERALGRAGR